MFLELGCMECHVLWPRIRLFLGIDVLGTPL